MFDHVILRPGELALKGGNRGTFERRLASNLAKMLEPLGRPPIFRRWGRFYVGPCTDTDRIARASARVFGIVNVSPARQVAADMDSIAAAGIQAVGRLLARLPGEDPVPFRVTTKRADKGFPLNSMACQRELGARLLVEYPRLRVDLAHADIDLGVEIRNEGTFVFVERIPAAGGLPVGCEGRVLSLLSGGIDSPVASWLAMKRGCKVAFCHFDSQPFTGPGSLEKVRQLAKVLGTWQGGADLLIVPFADCQVAMKEISRPGYRTVLYRRFMMRIAERLAKRQRALALVTGDSLGQVASQTLANIGVVEAATGPMPVLRPLIGTDKQEVVDRARQIGTYDISIQPFEDCCTLFQPDHPVTSGKPRIAAEIEADLDVDGLVGAAIEQVTREHFG